MSRRKQTIPQHIESEEALVSVLENGASSASQSDDEFGLGDEHICGKCRAEFIDLVTFLSHKKNCCRKRMVFIVDDDFDDEETVDEYYESTATNAMATLQLTHSSSYLPSEESTAALTALTLHQSKSQEDLANNNNELIKQEFAGGAGGELSKDEDDAHDVTDSKQDTMDMDTNDGFKDEASIKETNLSSGNGQLASSSVQGNGASNGVLTVLPHSLFPLSTPSIPQSPFCPQTMSLPYDSSSAVLGSSNVLLQALPNTKVAVSQISATALSNDRLSMSPKTSELVMLQSTLYSLQQQQMLQLQLIQQLQQQIITNSATGGTTLSTPGVPVVTGVITSTSPTVVPCLSTPTMVAAVSKMSVTNISCPPSTCNTPLTPTVMTTTAANLPLNPHSLPLPLPPPPPPPLPPISSSSSMSGTGNNSITMSNLVRVSSPSDFKEPINSLELLQRSAQQVLNNASQGLLAADLQFRSSSSKSGKGIGYSDSKSGGSFGRGSDDNFFKHRCRYCGKVFGSDSALQIHIRSHTGERPFKCNVCGNRFSTKGNLKVHFQRHKIKYPHIRMNPHPIPEELDKYAPPLHPHSPIDILSPSSLPTPNKSHHHHHHRPHHQQHHHPSSHHQQHHSQSFVPINPASYGSSRSSAVLHPMDLPSGGLDSISHSHYTTPLQASVHHHHHHRMSDHSKIQAIELPTTSSHEAMAGSRSVISNADSSASVAADVPSLTDDGDLTGQLKRDSLQDMAPKTPQSPGSISDGDSSDSSDGEDLDLRIHDRDELQNRQSRNQIIYPRSMSPQNDLPDHEDDDLMMNDGIDDDDDDFDSTNSKDSNLSQYYRRFSIIPHDDLSEPLPPTMSMNLDMSLDMKAYSRHSAPPATTFSSTLRDGSDNEDGGNGDFADDVASTMSANRPPNCGSPGSGNASSGENNHDAALDPALYTPLLPKPGSNDNSWESLIEITKTSETTKLQQLVDNIEHKLTDPNQCVICHRVLSCRSALQMHYRTHTGERPFKCKICSRAFTTKGNLKTHMGVHRAKPPMRVLHQCPVCHKKFTNALVLQQHIRMHTGEPIEMSPDQIRAAEVKEFLQPHTGAAAAGTVPTTLPHLFTPMSLAMTPLPSPIRPGAFKSTSAGTNLLSTVPSTSPSAEGRPTSEPTDDEKDDNPKPQTSTPRAPGGGEEGVIRCRSAMSDKSDKDVDVDREYPRTSSCGSMPLSVSTPLSIAGMSSFSTSLAALENHVKAISTPPPSLAQFGHLMAVASGAIGPYHRSIHEHHLHASAQLHHHSQQHHHHHHHRHHSSFRNPGSTQNGSKASPERRSTPSPHSRDGRSSPALRHRSGSPDLPRSTGSSISRVPRPPSPSVSSAGSPLNAALDLTPKSTTVITSSISSLVPLDMARNKSCPPGLGLSSPMGDLPLSLHSRLSTTCNICLKTFACNSALEIHYRSHTKERPFKCNVCDRAFSTKGNMKQHMLTHKIRDLPSQFFKANDMSRSESEQSLSPQVSPAVSMPSTPSAIPPPPPPPVSQSLPSPATGVEESGAILKVGHDSNRRDNDHHHFSGEHHHHHHHHHHHKKRPADDRDRDGLIPIPKRPPGLPKHFCHVCCKNFSSASALQIHMRTHTGDKPFKCNICERAFTTKGNLKVHMGTHMWNNGTSRRGRRMSIDLPPLPITPKDAEYLPRRPEHMYFPYLSPPFLNGLATKMNEISVIQSAVLSNGGLVSSPSMNMAVAAAAASSNSLNSSSNKTNVDGTATALRHSTELDLSCKKSPLPAEGARSSPSPSCSPMSKSSSIPIGTGNNAMPASPTSSCSSSPPPMTPEEDRVTRSPSMMAPWMWKMSCSLCSKLCDSPGELESHLKVHYGSDTKDAIIEVPKTEGLPV